MEQITIETKPLYKRSNDTLWFRDGNYLYKVGTYSMNNQITFIPRIGNVELLYHQREFNMITLNSLSLISFFSEAYNYKISKFQTITRDSSSVSKIIKEFHLDSNGCKYVLVRLSKNKYYIFIFEETK